MEDPRTPLPGTRDEVTRTPLEDDIEEREGRRKRQLRARGELLK
jgi:hypothetical protein